MRQVVFLFDRCLCFRLELFEVFVLSIVLPLFISGFVVPIPIVFVLFLFPSSKTSYIVLVLMRLVPHMVLEHALKSFV